MSDHGLYFLKPRVKLHHLLQKCSFFLIKLAVFLASGAAYMKLGQNGIVSFSIRLDARGQRRRSYETTVSFSIELVASAASGWAEHCNL